MYINRSTYILPRKKITALGRTFVRESKINVVAFAQLTLQIFQSQRSKTWFRKCRSPLAQLKWKSIP